MPTDQQIILGVENTLAIKRSEALRARNEFERLKSILPSDYTSIECGPNYTQFLHLLASEYARTRSMADEVYGDGRYSTTRLEYLFQNLGHRLHALGERHSFFPDIEYDEDYRRFLLALLSAVLNGATADSLLGAAKAATQLDEITLREYFKLIPPKQDPSLFDISYRNMWDYTVVIPPGTTNIAFIYLGLLFVGRLIKPGHTLFDVKLQLPGNRILEFDAGCCQDLGANGYLQASTITKSRAVSEEEEFQDCVIDTRHMRAKVTGTYQAGPMTLEVGGVTVQVTTDTIFSDIDGIYTTVSDLQIGDVVEIDGFTFDFPLDDGFPILSKIEPTAICVRKNWRLEQYKYRSYRVCRSDQLECYQIQNEVVNFANFPTRREFYVENYPMADDSNECEICYQTPFNGKTLVSVVHDDLISTITPLEVDFVDPYTGRVVLVADAPAGGEVRVDYRYWKGQPILGLHYDTDGLLYDQNVNCESHYTIYDHPSPEEEMDYCYFLGDGPYINNAFILNDDVDSLLNDPDSPLMGDGDGVFTAPCIIFCQLPYQPDEPDYCVHYSGFQHAHSTLYDTPNFEYDNPSAYRHHYDDYWVIDSRG